MYDNRNSDHGDFCVSTTQKSKHKERNCKQTNKTMPTSELYCG